ncbi:MAG: bacteriohemerythrin [Terracidiphilus sp.]
MTLLTWNHACSVGVLAMDDQHGILMDTINELCLALVRGSDGELIGELVERLLAFTRMHFENEEQLMLLNGFPGLEEHRAAHRLLLEQVRSGAYHLQHGEGVRMRALLGSLRNGYMEHIERLDRAYGPWLNARGVC